jgi:hypothetical protein
MMAIRRFSSLLASPTSQLAKDLEAYKLSAEAEHTHSESEVVFHHMTHGERESSSLSDASQKKEGEVTSPRGSGAEPVSTAENGPTK